MHQETPLLERAFILARSGQCRAAGDIVKALLSEGYSGAHSHLSSPSLRRQLNALCAATRRPVEAASNPETDPETSA